MADLYYGVIALKNSEVDQVIDKLKQQELDTIAKWLTLKKNEDYYGKRNEDWKPFNGQTISQLVNETKGYQTQTSLIDQFDLRTKNYAVVRSSPIRIYFIDVFALFLEKYSDLTSKLDALMAETKECCLIVSSDLPRDSQEKLIEAYCGVMGQVYDAYRGGNLHRIVMRVDDLKNFRNYILKTFGAEDVPTLAAERELKQRLPFETTSLPTL